LSVGDTLTKTVFVSDVLREKSLLGEKEKVCDLCLDEVGDLYLDEVGDLYLDEEKVGDKSLDDEMIGVHDEVA